MVSEKRTAIEKEIDMALGPSQRKTVVLASLILLLMAVFPPWQVGARTAHRFILLAYGRADGQYASIDAGLLLAEVMIVVSGAAIWCLLFCRSLEELQSDPVKKYLPEK